MPPARALLACMASRARKPPSCRYSPAMVGRCPGCGGVQRRLIAPGFYECTSSVLISGGQGTPPGSPGIGGRCGRRYHEGSSGVTSEPILCTCGVFAIGRCSDCRTPLCGDCGARFDSRFLCHTHINRAKKVASEGLESTRRAVEKEAALARAAEGRRQDEQLARLRATSGIHEGDVRIEDLADALGRWKPSEQRQLTCPRTRSERRFFGSRTISTTHSGQGWAFAVDIVDGRSYGDSVGNLEILYVFADGYGAYRYVTLGERHLVSWKQPVGQYQEPRFVRFFDYAPPAIVVPQRQVDRILLAYR